MGHLVIYVISDSLGETGEQVARAAVSQFDITDYEIRRYSYVLTRNMVEEILEEAKQENSVILYTVVQSEYAQIITDFAIENDIPHINLLEGILNSIEKRVHKKPKREPGIIRKLDDSYFKRVEAIEFAVKYDDGKDPRGLKKADLVILGISRTSKTPLSMYLANKNIKVANIPLVPEAVLPKEVFEIPKKRIVGLTNSPEKLNSIRRERLKALGLSGEANYASMKRILDEIDYAEKIMRKIGCPIIDVSDKAIEETAGIIIDILKMNGIKVYKNEI
ncbi:MAG: kinase/pyrophosphorylase [Peptostreptococcaceae bacterium]|jgi:regulator of PEP synthase PpsR (kinase-PPPase family)|nr:kinase/pyrophosphorylase [Peptostreptococcaceae bacterium]